MQQGVFLLWVVCIGISLGAWIYLEVVFSRYGAFVNRRKLTGYELARQLLDRNQLSRVTVTSAEEGKRSGDSLERFSLPEAVYHGKRLTELAQALHETERFLCGFRSVVTLYLRALGGRSFQILIAASWGLVLIGAAFSPARSVATLGQLLYVVANLLVLATLGEEFEAARRGLSSLASLEGFETDERVRLKKLLEAMRWSRAAELFQALFELARLTRKKLSHALSKPE